MTYEQEHAVEMARGKRAIMLINIQIAVGIASFITLLFNYPQ